jgi:hypothetical protein
MRLLCVSFDAFFDNSRSRRFGEHWNFATLTSDEEGKVLSGKTAQTITDGPFTESKEAVGGYFLISAKDCQAAVEIAKD